MATSKTLADLDLAVKKRQRAFRTKQSRRYHLARELGFSAEEAVVLQNWPEATIRKLAEERQAKAKERHSP